MASVTMITKLGSLSLGGYNNSLNNRSSNNYCMPPKMDMASSRSTLEQERRKLVNQAMALYQRKNKVDIREPGTNQGVKEDKKGYRKYGGDAMGKDRKRRSAEEKEGRKQPAKLMKTNGSDKGDDSSSSSSTSSDATAPSLPSEQKQQPLPSLASGRHVPVATGKVPPTFRQNSHIIQPLTACQRVVGQASDGATEYSHQLLLSQLTGNASHVQQRNDASGALAHQLLVSLLRGQPVPPSAPTANLTPAQLDAFVREQQRRSLAAHGLALTMSNAPTRGPFGSSLSTGSNQPAVSTSTQGYRELSPNPCASPAWKPSETDVVVPMSVESDSYMLSEYQQFLREQICMFEATKGDLGAIAQGRNKPIKLGQVGIICRHCQRLQPGSRTKGAAYFPSKLSYIYHAAQNMATNHFNTTCAVIPQATRNKLLALKEKKPLVLARGGKPYWASAARQAGVVEGEEGLWFRSSKSL